MCAVIGGLMGEDQKRMMMRIYKTMERRRKNIIQSALSPLGGDNLINCISNVSGTGVE